MKQLSILLVALFLLISITSCDSNKKYRSQIETDITPIKDVFEKDFPVGAAIEPYQLEAVEGELLKYHFSSLTAENAMKFKSIHPEKDKFYFDNADKIVKFAKKNKMKVRGHAFVWHHPAEMANWVFTNEAGDKRTREEVLEILQNHIETIMTRYGEDIYAWDVVNEVIDVAEDDNLRRTAWYNAIGPDYVAEVFHIARKVNPNIKLFINDYDTYIPQKREALYEFIKKLLDSGVPIDGVGMQLHIGIARPSIKIVEETIDMFSSLGLEVHITELDMSLYAKEFDVFTEAPEDYLIRQAHQYQELFKLFKNKKSVTSVTMWGFNDGHTWLTNEPYNRPDWPLPFDANFKSKLAYQGIIQAKLPDDIPVFIDREPLIYKASKGSIEVDGEIDPIWNNVEPLKTELQLTPIDGAYADVKLLWDENSLYVLAKVMDKKIGNSAQFPYQNDSFEIFLDENNGKTETFETDDVQLRVGVTGGKSVGGYGKTTMFKSKTVRLPDEGYLVELKFDFQSVKSAGSIMGIDFQVNDNIGGSDRVSVSKWNDPSNESWRNTSKWGIIELVE